MVAPAITAAIITVVATIILGIIGYYHRKFQNKLGTIEELEAEVNEANQRIEKLMAILFGNELDKSDDGLTEEVQNGFDDLASDLQDIDKEVDELDDAISFVIIRLDQDDNIDLDKDNLEYEAELKKLK